MQAIMLTRFTFTRLLAFEFQRVRFNVVVPFFLMGWSCCLFAEDIFPDKALEAAIRQEVFAKRYTTDPITAEDVKSISRVVGKGKKIASLEGLQHCKAIMEIDLENNAISDLGPVRELKLLQSVNFAGNQIESIEALTDLTKLQYLELSRNKISDLEPLKSMSNMRSLYLTDNQIASLAPLAEMKKVWTLYAGKNPIKDFEAIGKLAWLESLDLHETDLKDLAFLVTLTELKRLTLAKNKIDDLANLVEMCEKDASGPRRFAPFLKLDLRDNPLSETAKTTQVAKLKEMGVRITQEGDTKP
jgi:Leucine-rich repeat (LRR) protein